MFESDKDIVSTQNLVSPSKNPTIVARSNWSFDGEEKNKTKIGPAKVADAAASESSSRGTLFRLAANFRSR